MEEEIDQDFENRKNMLDAARICLRNGLYEQAKGLIEASKKIQSNHE